MGKLYPAILETDGSFSIISQKGPAESAMSGVKRDGKELAPGSTMQKFREIMEIVGLSLDVMGVVVICAGVALAAGRSFSGGQGLNIRSYTAFRQSLGRAILLGLEFLVAGDIIRTVVVSPTIENVVTLGIIVLIRTFLSMSLEIELGNIPWKKKGETG